MHIKEAGGGGFVTKPLKDYFRSTDSGSRSENQEYVFNSDTGDWRLGTTPSSDPTGTPPATNTDDGSGGQTPASKVDSKSKADKEFIEIEYNTLEGDLSLIPSKKTLSVKAGDTIQLEGVGKFLSGLYYVSAVKRTIDNGNGYSLSLTVIKTGFADSLKGGSDSSSDSPQSSCYPSRPAEVTPTFSPNFSEGDKVMFLTVESNKYTYANSADGVLVPKWVTEKVHTVSKVSSDGQRVLLKEVQSWTYVKFLKKV